MVAHSMHIDMRVIIRWKIERSVTVNPE